MPHDLQSRYDLSDPAVCARIRRLHKLARGLDLAFEIPGTGKRFGADSLIGLVPGVGDLATSGISLFIVYEGWRLGASKPLLGRMLGNIMIDFGLGSIPLLGDAFDFVFKANVMNLRLLGIDANEPLPPEVAGGSGASRRVDNEAAAGSYAGAR